MSSEPVPLAKQLLKPLIGTPIAIKPEYISKTQTVLQIIQSSTWKRNYQVLRDDNLLFTIKGKGFWHYSHDILDVSGLPVLEIRRQWSKSSYWVLRVPDTGKELGTGGWQLTLVQLKFDFVIRNAAAVGSGLDGEGPETKVEIRGTDLRQIVFHVLVEGNLVATIQRKNALSRDDPSWELRVTEGFDLSLAVTMAIAIGDIIATQKTSAYSAAGVGVGVGVGVNAGVGAVAAAGGGGC